MHQKGGLVPLPGPARQREIYRNGLTGGRPAVPTNAEALERLAERTMTPQAWAYVSGGAGSGSTMRANRDAFARWRIVPRVLRDVSARDLSIELLGSRLASPFLLAPIGVLEMAHPDADLAVARAARSAGVPMILSNQASVPMEACARALGESARWFQLLEHIERSRGQFRATGGSLWVWRTRADSRHHHAGLANRGPRPGVASLSARDGNRAVHE